MNRTKARILVEDITNSKIEYDAQGRIHTVELRANVNSWTVASSTYSRIVEDGVEDIYFESHFDEHHEIDVRGRRIGFDELPDEVQTIFGAGTIDGVQELMDPARFNRGYRHRQADIPVYDRHSEEQEE